MASIQKALLSKTKRIEEAKREEEFSCSTTRDNAFDDVLRFKGKKDVDKSIIFETLERTLLDKFQILYDVFYKIIRDRLSVLQQNETG